MATDRKRRKRASRGLAAILPWKGDKPAEVLRKIIFLASLIALLVFGYQILDTLLLQAQKANEVVNKASEVYSKPPTSEVVKKAEEKGIPPKIQQLIDENADAVGWINITGTNVDNPVVQTDDNAKYLKTAFDGSSNDAGTVFADYRVKITKDSQPDNTILYGHNMREGTFFADVLKYRKLSYYQEHPIVTFDTLNGEGTYKILGAFFADPLDDRGSTEFEQNYHNRQAFSSEEDFNAFISDVRTHSVLDIPGVDAQYGDKLLTLSTCGSNWRDFKDSRFVVVARKLRDGESGDVDVTTASNNTDVKMPPVWYEVHGSTASPFDN